MTSLKRFEQLMVEQAKTLDEIRATIDRIHYLIQIITEQIRLEQQWSSLSSDIEAYLDRQNDQTLGS